MTCRKNDNISKSDIIWKIWILTKFLPYINADTIWNEKKKNILEKRGRAKINVLCSSTYETEYIISLYMGGIIKLGHWQFFDISENCQIVK